MFDILHINWWVVIVATLIYFILGAVWFTPLFGNVYDKALETKRIKGQKWPMIYYIGPFLSAFVTTAATATLLHVLDITRFLDAIWLGVIVGVGYALSVSVNNAINPKVPHPILYGLVTGGYHVIGITLVVTTLFWMK